MISDPDWMTIIAQHYHSYPDFQHPAKYPQLDILDTPPKYRIIFSPQLELALISKIAQNGSKQICIPSNCRKREQDGTIIGLRETLIQNAHTTLGHMSGHKTYDYLTDYVYRPTMRKDTMEYCQ